MIYYQVFTKNRIFFSLKNATKEFSTIRVRMTYKGERFSYHLSNDFAIAPKHWDKQEQRAIENPKLNPDLKSNPILQITLRNINKEIEKTTNTLLRVIENFKLLDTETNVEEIKLQLRKELRGEEPEVKPQADRNRIFTYLLLFIDYYINMCYEGKILNNKQMKLAIGSIRNYEALRKILKRYSDSRHIKLTFDSIDMNFYHDFISYLNEIQHSRGGYKLNVVGKFIKHLKIILGYAYKQGYTKNDKFREFKVSKEEGDAIYLNENELLILYNLDLLPTEAQIRDVFLLACYTGLRYSDLARLEKRHIDYDEGIISIMTQKTGNLAVIPIHPIVRSILDKYDGNPPKSLSNQATNRMLKIIGEKASIDATINQTKTESGSRREKTVEKYKLISTHTGRRSFVTNALKKGMQPMEIMQMTGHRTHESFMAYARMTKHENARSLKSHEFFKNN